MNITPASGVMATDDIATRDGRCDSPRHVSHDGHPPVGAMGSQFRLPSRSQTFNSVRFSNEVPETQFLPQRRSSTGITANSTASSILDESWAKQYVLSFDGGGIRGYSSLLIIRELMTKIANEERTWKIDEKLNPAETSFDPCQASRKDEGTNISTSNAVRGSSWLHNRWHKPRRGKQDTISRRQQIGTEGARPTGREISDESESANGNDEVSRAARERQQRSNYLPCHYFDYMGGTSTGGRLRMPVDDALDEYQTLAGEIFGHPRIASVRPSWRGPIPWPRDKYDGRRVVKVVNDVVNRRLALKPGTIGQNLLSSHASMCKTVVVSYQQKKVEDGGDVPEEPPYLFRSYDHHPRQPFLPWQRNPGLAHRLPIWQVARATSAAPTYFNSITIENRKFGDGGFGTNNPTDEIYHEVRLMNGDESAHVALVLSIGTGKNPVHRFSDKVFGKFSQIPGALKKLAVDCERVHEGMTRRREPGGMRYFRFNVDSDVLRKISLDEWKAPNWRHKENLTLENITKATEKYLEESEVQRSLQDVARLLVKSRRERCRTPTWKLASTGMLYRCQHPGCPSQKSQKMRISQKNLEAHLKSAHGVVDAETLDHYVRIGEYSP
ncbi:MAG: hypothetical protein M1837_006678 [Sclerophora amabilis]|nr:MAG: hypothetical protein M1837_006678 [Sclerophora amabilis]